jgi:isopenicillin N synthase-like dioxygenase
MTGQWIDVPPIENTFVINIGRGTSRSMAMLLQVLIPMNIALEFVTQGLARATSHRVVSPPRGSGPRYSVPFFQNIGPNVRLTEKIIHCMPYDSSFY